MRELKKLDPCFKITDDVIFDDAFEMFLSTSESIEDSREWMCISAKNSSTERIFDKDVTEPSSDTSVTNASSVAFIMEYESKKALFLGDAHDRVIFSGLEKYKNSGNTL